MRAHFEPLSLAEERAYVEWCARQSDYVGRVDTFRAYRDGVEAHAALVGLLKAVESERYVEGTREYRRALEVVGRVK